MHQHVAFYLLLHGAEQEHRVCDFCLQKIELSVSATRC